MIDANSEQLITLSEAAKLCPRRRGGKSTHVSCVYRWTKNGCRGVVLESIQIGGTRCTSREALSRFFDRLTFGNDARPQVRYPAKRRQAADAAIEALAREGA